MQEASGQSDEIIQSLVVGEIRDTDGISLATARLHANGDLVLYCTDSGYAVMLQIGENVMEWRRWYTVAATDVPRLVDDPATVLEAVRDAVVVPESGNRYVNESAKIEGRFADWLRSHAVPYTYRSEDYPD